MVLLGLKVSFRWFNKIISIMFFLISTLQECLNTTCSLKVISFMLLSFSARSGFSNFFHPRSNFESRLRTVSSHVRASPGLFIHLRRVLWGSQTGRRLKAAPHLNKVNVSAMNYLLAGAEGWAACRPLSTGARRRFSFSARLKCQRRCERFPVSAAGSRSVCLCDRNYPDHWYKELQLYL